MDLATPLNSVRRKIFDKEDLETSAFAVFKKGLLSQIRTVRTKSLGYILRAFLAEQENHLRRLGVGTFCLHSSRAGISE